MMQHPVDLLPDSMRARTQARVTASRNLTIVALMAVVIILAATQASVSRSRAEAGLASLSVQSQRLEANEAKVRLIRQEIAEYASLNARYWSVETPIPIARVIAAIIHQMPESMSFDRIDLQTERTRSSPRTRTGGHQDLTGSPPRLLVGELSGFARTDLDIAGFAERLGAMPPFSKVTLDFSRPRTVRGRNAREFRLSFVIDLATRYVIADEAPHPTEGGHAHGD